MMKVEGGNGGYSHAPMLISYQSMEDLRIDTLTLKTSPGHWEDGAAKNDLESKQYGAGDSFIILIDGRYYVYKTVNGNNVSLGVFDSEAEVDAVL